MEKIICSAYNIDWAIIVWKRHHNCIRSIVESWIKEHVTSDIPNWFYTNKFRFVDRIEWMKIAKDADQLVMQTYWDLLFSEDLR